MLGSPAVGINPFSSDTGRLCGNVWEMNSSDGQVADAFFAGVLGGYPRGDINTLYRFM
jgi:hypothetical protein